MTVPVDGVAPVLIAVLPISESETHATLVPHLMQVLRGLIKVKIQAVSYSCDGTELERKIHRAVLSKASKHLRYPIKSP
jgi:hypothetical protein